MRYLCRFDHVHSSELGVRDCERTAFIDHESPRVVLTGAAPTESQLNYITSLGGDRARIMDRLGASEYIKTLKSARDTRPMTQPAYTPPIAPMLLDIIPTGYYALRLDDEQHTFIRISRPTKGALAGGIHVQTQHSEGLVSRVIIIPGRQWRFNMRRRVNGVDIVDYLKLLITTHRAAAMEYGSLLDQCCKCNKALTDERSRWYSIGPECEKHNSDYMTEVIDVRGEYFVGVVA